MWAYGGQIEILKRETKISKDHASCFRSSSFVIYSPHFSSLSHSISFLFFSLSHWFYSFLLVMVASIFITKSLIKAFFFSFFLKKKSPQHGLWSYNIDSRRTKHLVSLKKANLWKQLFGGRERWPLFNFFKRMGIDIIQNNFSTESELNGSGRTSLFLFYKIKAPPGSTLLLRLGPS